MKLGEKMGRQTQETKRQTHATLKTKPRKKTTLVYSRLLQHPAKKNTAPGERQRLTCTEMD